MARACGNRGEGALFFFKLPKKSWGRWEGTTDGCMMGARSCGCTGRSVHHQTRMQLDFLSLGSELYVVIESHRASRVHIDVGGGALSSVSCHHHQKAGGGCPSFWVFLAKVVGGGGFRGAGRGTTSVHSDGKLRCDSTFCQGVGAVMIAFSSRIGYRVPPHDGGGVRCWSRHPLAPTLEGKRGRDFQFFRAKCLCHRSHRRQRRRVAVCSARFKHQMRLDFLSQGGFSHLSVESHRVYRAVPRHWGGALLVTSSSRSPLGTAGRSASFWFFCLAHGRGVLNWRRRGCTTFG